MAGRVVVALRVGVPATRAFELFTEHIGEWWQPNALFRTHPGGAATLSFEDGRLLARPTPRSPDSKGAQGREAEPYELGTVIAWEPPQRLAFSWRQPDFPTDLQTHVEVRFHAVEPGVTRVSVEHRGFTAVPGDSAARHTFPDNALQQRLAEWWQTQLVALRRRSMGG